MIEITLPDRSKRNFDEPLSIFELAQDIGPGLAKATLAGIIDGEEHDACHLIEKNSEVSILTNKDKQGLDIIRQVVRIYLVMQLSKFFLKPRWQLVQLLTMVFITT